MGRCLPSRASALAPILFALGFTNPLQAQEPPDTAPPPPPAAQDTAAVQPQDTADADGPSDSVEVLKFPRFVEIDTASPILRKRWEHSNLLGTGALDLGELLEFHPALVPIRAGFFEGPQTHVFAGSGAPSLRILVDGYDFVPIGTAGYLDTHLISLAEYDRVELIRTPGGYQLDMDLFRRDRAEAYSRINGGTGDRDTNLIGGVFAAGFLGAPIAFSFDRVDSRGSTELGSMERNSLWATASHPLPADVWGQVEFRRTIADRDSLIGTDRTDVIVRFRRPLGPSWTTDLIVGRGSVTETPGDTVEQAGGPADREFSATQVALRAGRRGERWSGSASLRAYTGDGVPDLLNELTLGLELGPLTLSGAGRHERWSDFTVYSGHASTRLELPLGLRVGAELEDGGRALMGGSPPVRREFFTRLSGQIGLSHGVWDLWVKGGRWRVSPSPALGAPFDSLMALGGGTASVFEARATVPVLRLFDGQLSAGAYYQVREAGAFLYWPKDQWFIEGRYHNLALEDQLEIELSARGGVRGPMLVSDVGTDPTSVFPSEDLNWFRGELVVRIKDVYIFWNLEAFDSQLVDPVDVPGLVLPRSRSHFGLRWQFWN